MTTKIETYVVDAVARLPHQHKGKASLEAFLSSIVAPAQDVENALWELLTERAVDSAVGVQLDAIGSVVGQPRNGLDDATYRRYVRARISANRSSGLVEDILRVLYLIVYDDDATLVVDPQYPAGLVLRVAEVAITEELADVSAEFLGDSVSAGVRSLLEFSTAAPAETFVLDDSTAAVVPVGLGFDDSTDPGDGGAFSGVIDP